MGYRIGVDVGGTFTDFVLLDGQGNYQGHKTSTTPHDPSIGLIQGLTELADERNLRLEDFLSQIELIVHGTTVTTNAVLTGNGAKTALLTTSGFRDILQMRRGVRDRRFLYNNKFVPPRPLVPRDLRLPVRERVNKEGQVLQQVDRETLAQAIKVMTVEGVQAVAVCFMHSYANPNNERQAVEMVKEALPGVFAVASYEVLPEVRLYNRVSTTVLSAYVGPVLNSYLHSLMRRLEEFNFRGVFLIMQSNGGVASVKAAMKTPATTLLSGPAGGPNASLLYSRELSFDSCVLMDMGGTSFDTSLVTGGKAQVTRKGEINHQTIALPMIDIHTIGAGGGSIGWVDEGGFLRVGPKSAGANPGPACYMQGGTYPTCTDADLVLGYLDKDFFLGGRIRLDDRAAREAIKTYVADPLSISVEEAAAGMVQVINLNMATGIKEVTIQKGYDPREFPLVVAGGAGAVHAAMIALELDVPLVVIQRQCSVFCAMGMLLSDLQHDYVRSYHGLWDEVELRHVITSLEEMAREGRETLLAENVSEGRTEYRFAADLRYFGQHHELTVDLDLDELREGTRENVSNAFHQHHNDLYGFSTPESPVELISLRVTCLGKTEHLEPRTYRQAESDAEHWRKGARPVYFPSLKEFIDVPVYDGERMEYGNMLQGPAVIEMLTTTLLIPPEFSAEVDRLGSFVLRNRNCSQEGKVS